MFENGGHAGQSFQYQGRDTANRMLVVPTDALRRTRTKVPGPNGLKEEVFYFGQKGRVPNLKGRRPSSARNVKQVNYLSASSRWRGFVRADHFAALWTGALMIGKH